MSLKFYITNKINSIVDSIVEKSMDRIKTKKTNMMAELKKAYVDAVANTPNPAKKYEEEYKIKKLNKTINDIALWHAEREQIKKSKNPKAKPIVRQSKDYYRNKLAEQTKNTQK